MITHPTHRQWQKLYREDLIARVCKVKCPKCGAKPGERCIGQYGRRTASYHYIRSDLAKQKGFVSGKKNWNQ